MKYAEDRRALKVTRPRVKKASTPCPDQEFGAYDFFLRGLNTTPAHSRIKHSGTTYVESAIGLDAQFAAAYAMLGDLSHGIVFQWGDLHTRCAVVRICPAAVALTRLSE